MIIKKINSKPFKFNKKDTKFLDERHEDEILEIPSDLF